MSKSELIAAIQKFNRTVSAEFLERFGEPDLRAYLERIGAVMSASPGETRPASSGLHATIDTRQALIVA